MPQRVQKGVGASVQFVINPVLEFGVNAAIGKQVDVDAFARPVLENSFTTKSVGGFANVRFTDHWVAGTGVNWTTQTDTYLATGSTLNDFTCHLQGFGALQYRPLGQLYIKTVGRPCARGLPAQRSGGRRVAERHGERPHPVAVHLLTCAHRSRTFQRFQ